MDIISWWGMLGLGAFHGINPGMGWLFAVALGMQEKRRSAVIGALFPMALGHAISIAVVVFVIALAQRQLPEGVLRIACATVLFGFGVYKFFSARHPKWVGMRVNFKDLTIWSFLMASAHGAGLMLAPLLLRMPAAEASGHMHHAPASMTDSTVMLLSAVGVHTLSFFLVMGVVAVIVYEVVGLALLRKAWFNLDLLWAIALMIAGIVTLFLKH
ncbi:MAG: hypothetical protein OXU51_02910 [Candidatus Poribacteria bacterium]|nr:hypothetical protein [Candidatus Poribacteria bacterium]